jgi:hypothetical protein
MIKDLTRTCDMCHRTIPSGEYVQRNSERDAPDILMVLIENADRDLRLIELPDGTISLDTCVSCYLRIPFNHSTAIN